MSKINLTILSFFHILVHYFTFERLSFGADTFADFNRIFYNPPNKLLDYFLTKIDRPLNFLFIEKFVKR